MKKLIVLFGVMVISICSYSQRAAEQAAQQAAPPKSTKDCTPICYPPSVPERNIDASSVAPPPKLVAGAATQRNTFTIYQKVLLFISTKGFNF
ncbi:MAG: hypothetical protein ACK4RF_00380 [Cyclobacteriaceae bacterium]